MACFWKKIIKIINCQISGLILSMGKGKKNSRIFCNLCDIMDNEVFLTIWF